MKVIRKILTHIRYEYILLNIVSIIISSCFYIIFLHITELYLDKYIEEHNIVSIQEEKSAFSFQQFVQNNHISVNDLASIKKWTTEQPYLLLKLYKNDSLIYDSLWDISSDKSDSVNSISSATSKSFYEIDFYDGTASALFFCFYETKIYNSVKIFLFILSLILYISINSIYIGKKITYVTQLDSDIKVLSTGKLDHLIPIKGSDELAHLAIELDHLRLSVLDTIQNEKAAYNANHELITTLSHDLRTPLTSLIGYLEISLDQTLCPITEIHNYQEAALNKAYRLKDLTDKLFEYFLVTSQGEDLSSELVNGNELVFQMVEEPLCDLEAKNIQIIREISDIDCKLLVNVNLIHRLFDNIFSNINKYADLSFPVTVHYYLADGNLILTFENKINNDPSNENSSKIGLKSCEAILAKHKGHLVIDNTKETFKLTVYLPFQK